MKIGQIVALLNADGEPTGRDFRILSIGDNMVRLVGTNNEMLRVHPSRIILSGRNEMPEKKETPSFDVNKFVKEHGGEHWVRGEKGEINFDHKEFTVCTHAVINENAGFYYYLNTYTRNGVVSLGKSNKGITKYPFKGHTVEYTVSQSAKKEESRGATRSRVGSKTPDQLRKQLKKNGYKKKG